MTRIRITTAPWLYGVLAFNILFCTLGVVLLISTEPGWEFWGTVMLLIMFSAALLSSTLTKIEDNGEFVTIVNNFKKTDVPKKSIEKVSWEKGIGAHLILVNGSFLKLPTTGRNEQGVANSVRSWLVRTL